MRIISDQNVKNKCRSVYVASEEKMDKSSVVLSLLRQTVLAGCIVTVEAVETQKEIARQIIEQNSEYVLAIGENQKMLYEDVQKVFAFARMSSFAQIQHKFHQIVQYNVGGLTRSQHWIIDDPNYIRYLDPEEDWKGLSSIGMVQLIHRIDSRESKEIYYYLLSFSDDAKKFAEAVKNSIGTLKLTFTRY